MSTEPTPWRKPAEESTDLYPGLAVWDKRVSGSITVGPSRLPLWAFIYAAIVDGWDEVEKGYSPGEHYGWSEVEMGRFLTDLLECRGEFGRLLLVLADAERSERRRGARGKAWWQTKRHRKRVADQLRRCLTVVEE